MSVTLSHQSALDAMRTLRCDGVRISDMDVVPLADPSSWMGKRLRKSDFNTDVWSWSQPAAGHPLHILVPNAQARMRGSGIVSHVASGDLPAESIHWHDKHSRIVCPELLFLQMAESFSLPALVMLGLEMCGHFSRHPDNPLTDDVIDKLPTATSVERLWAYLSKIKKARGLVNARSALRYVRDHAASAPEAVLATMYGLPPAEGGYGMGPVRLNERVKLGDSGAWKKVANRYPDLMFDFAPMGLNYDGSKHFDIASLMAAAEMFAHSKEANRDTARNALEETLLEARAKVIDDNMRDRQLAAQGRIVLSVTKEDLTDIKHLDELTRQVLGCAGKALGIDVDAYRKTLDNTDLTRERDDLLRMLTPHGGIGASSYGKM